MNVGVRILNNICVSNPITAVPFIVFNALNNKKISVPIVIVWNMPNIMNNFLFVESVLFILLLCVFVYLRFVLWTILGNVYSFKYFKVWSNSSFKTPSSRKMCVVLLIIVDGDLVMCGNT